MERNRARKCRQSRVAGGCAIIALSCAAASVSGQLPASPPSQIATDNLPDPSTIVVPDVPSSSDPKVRKEGHKFYYFHGRSVSFAEAYVDFKECRGHLVKSGHIFMPAFVPFDAVNYRKKIVQPQNYGLVGAAIGAIVAPKMERGLQSSQMRRCMGTRGYARYAIPEGIWGLLNEGEEEKLVLMQAKLASGPAPQDVEVTE